MPLLHPDQFDVTAADAARLLRAQFPELAELRITPVPSSGTMNAIFRVGDRHSARLPFIPWGADPIRNEAALLPLLGAVLPVPVPTVVGLGEPDDGYPCPWLVLEWLPGTPPKPGTGGAQLADDVAEVVLALHGMDTTAAVTSPRGLGLHDRDTLVRE